MTTAPRISGSGNRSGSIAAVMRPALLVTLVIGVVAGGLGLVLDGSAGLFGTLIGIGMVVVFFGTGAAVLDVVARLAPAASLLVALLTYTLQVVLVGLVFVGLTESGALESAVDPRWLAGTLIAGTLGWLAAQVRASMRVRLPLYDLPTDEAGQDAGTVSKDREAGAR